MIKKEVTINIDNNDSMRHINVQTNKDQER